PDPDHAARRGAAAAALSVRARRGDPAYSGGMMTHDRLRESTGRDRCYFTGAVEGELRVACATRAVSASADSFFCPSAAAGCAMPADINSVIAASTVMSRSMISRRGT